MGVAGKVCEQWGVFGKESRVLCVVPGWRSALAPDCAEFAAVLFERVLIRGVEGRMAGSSAIVQRIRVVQWLPQCIRCGAKRDSAALHASFALQAWYRA